MARGAFLGISVGAVKALQRMNAPVGIVFDGVHLCCDGGDLEALHAFAARIGLRRAWFQEKDWRHPHYDVLSPRIIAKARRAGARMISTRLMAKLSSAGRLALGSPCVRPLTPEEQRELRGWSVEEKEER